MLRARSVRAEKKGSESFLDAFVSCSMIVTWFVLFFCLFESIQNFCKMTAGLLFNRLKVEITNKTLSLFFSDAKKPEDSYLFSWIYFVFISLSSFSSLSSVRNTSLILGMHLLFGSLSVTCFCYFVYFANFVMRWHQETKLFSLWPDWWPLPRFFAIIASFSSTV